MRRALAQKNEVRSTFRGRFVRFGTKYNRFAHKHETTLLLIDIRDCDGNRMTDHLWFNYTKGFQAIDLAPGDVVEFDARVTTYAKNRGWRDDFGERYWDPGEIDYKLSRPTKIRIAEKGSADLTAHMDHPLACHRIKTIIGYGITRTRDVADFTGLPVCLLVRHPHFSSDNTIKALLKRRFIEREKQHPLACHRIKYAIECGLTEFSDIATTMSLDVNLTDYYMNRNNN